MIQQKRPPPNLGLILILSLMLGVGVCQEVRSQAFYLMDPQQRVEVDLSGDLKTVDGETVSLKQLSDRALMVNFWATWCGPCRAEMPSMEDLYRSHGSRGLEIVAVTDEDPETVRAFLERNRYSFPVLIDKNAQLAARLQIFSIPFTLIFDKNGKLVHFHEGARLWNTPTIKANIEAILNE